MAEVIGLVASGITLAGLFQTCLDTFDLIHTAQHQERDVRNLVLKLKIEKVRMITWGEVMGLNISPDASHPGPLRSCADDIRGLVRDILETIVQLFTDAQKLNDRYGCKEELAPMLTLPETNGTTVDEFGPIEKLTASFSRSRVGGRLSSKTEKYFRTTRWVIYDSKKFPTLVAEVKAFVDALHDTTQFHSSLLKQSETLIRRGLQRVSDIETLDLVAEICAADHPDISKAASEISTSMSMTAPERIQDIEDWSSGVTGSTDADFAELESLTVTELKHRLLTNINGRTEVEDTAMRARPASMTLLTIRFVGLCLLPITLHNMLLDMYRRTDITSNQTSNDKLWQFLSALPIAAFVVGIISRVTTKVFKRRRLGVEAVSEEMQT